jgi:NAD+ synthase
MDAYGAILTIMLHPISSLLQKNMNANTKLNTLKSELDIEPEAVTRSLVTFIQTHADKLERDGAILGLSGGIDSAVVAALCQRAVGTNNTLALILPDRDSQKEHTEDALELGRQLGIQTKTIDITLYLKELGIYRLFPLHKLPIPDGLKGPLVRKAYNLYQRKTGESPFSASLLGFKDKEFQEYLGRSNAYYRAKHRLRMLLLYLHGELENRLVVGSANKSEYLIGFFVKHGCDDAVDVMPLLRLYKTQVRALARYLGIPSRVIDKPPSPDIIPGITDESAIGIPYNTLDLILLALEKEWSNSCIAHILELKEKQVLYIKDLTLKSEHLRTTYTPDARGLVLLDI